LAERAYDLEKNKQTNKKKNITEDKRYRSTRAAVRGVPN
jgi:hypothetical protein